VKPVHYIMLVFALAKAYVMLFRYHLLDWDESVYISMARYVYSGGKLGLFEHIRPLGLPIMMPFGSIILADLVVLVFSLGVIYLSYRIARDFAGEKAAIWSAIFVAASPVFFVYSLKVYTGIPTMFFVLFSLLLIIRKQYAWSGLAAGIAFLFRFPAGLILPALLLLTRKPKPALKLIAVFTLAILPYLAYSTIAYGGPFYTLSDAIGHQDNEFFRINGLTQNLLYYPFVLVYPLPVLLLGFAAVFFYKKRLNYVGVPFILFLAYFTWIVNKQPRFALMMLPFLAMLAAYSLFRIARLGKAIRYVAYVFAAVSLAYALMSDYMHVAAMPHDEPGIMEYYRYGYSGTVLTTDPGPAVYSDARFIPVYDNVQSAWEGYNSIDADIFILYPDVLPCYDSGCNMTTEMLLGRLDTEELVYTYDVSRYVYKIK